MRVTKLDTFNTNDELMDGCGYEGIFADKGYVLTDFKEITTECIEETLEQVTNLEKLDNERGFTSRGTWKLCLVKLDEIYDKDTFHIWSYRVIKIN